ncbi:hypothetical protein B0T20DRAFT_397875 [Sordaria brevicollis]|uniref:Uncharacterized protein n=1 Tax=Sordaria brevicollis TaxID=83679 RepID=A0AAE0NVL4_SORBR|nr:hypothetical protein B0T20DRAFT_397875 [Sordaria brevicollis]
MAAVELLPFEMRERICELVGHIPERSLDYLIKRFDPINDGTSPYLLHHEHPAPKYPRAYSSAYSDLRALSLACKAFVEPSQRVLLETTVVRGSFGIVRLLQMLLLHPKRRTYVRRLAFSRRDSGDQWDLRWFLRLLAVPCQSTHLLDSLQHRDQFYEVIRALAAKIGSSFLWEPYRSRWRRVFRELPLVSHDALCDYVLRSVVQLCPLIQEIGLSYAHGPFLDWGHQLNLPRSPREVLFFFPFAHLESLALDVATLDCHKSLFAHKPFAYTQPNYPNVKSIALYGSSKGYYELRLSELRLWLLPFKGLRELRLLRGCVQDIPLFTWDPEEDPDNQNPRLNWNEVLVTLKDTLEVLEVEGKVFGHITRISQSHMATCFGLTQRLVCLPELTKLKYLRAPLYMLRGEIERVHWPRGDRWDAQAVLELIMTGLPPSLKTMDVLVVTEWREGEMADLGTRRIVASESVRVDL